MKKKKFWLTPPDKMADDYRTKTLKAKTIRFGQDFKEALKNVGAQ